MSAKGGVPRERTFGGKQYLLVDAGYGYYAAKKAAKELRSRGYNVRRVSTENQGAWGYALYRRNRGG